MSKYNYIHFDDDVPKNIEIEYNKLCRKEQYLEERDAAHRLIHIDYDALLNNVPELPHDTISKSEIIWEKRRKYLPTARAKELLKKYIITYKNIK